MTIVIFIFLALWIAVSAAFLVSVEKVFQLFPTLSKIAGVNPEKIPPPARVFYRVLATCALAFGLFLFVMLLDGRLVF